MLVTLKWLVTITWKDLTGSQRTELLDGWSYIKQHCIQRKFWFRYNRQKCCLCARACKSCKQNKKYVRLMAPCACVCFAMSKIPISSPDEMHDLSLLQETHTSHRKAGVPDPSLGIIEAMRITSWSFAKILQGISHESFEELIVFTVTRSVGKWCYLPYSEVNRLSSLRLWL